MKHYKYFLIGASLCWGCWGSIQSQNPSDQTQHFEVGLNYEYQYFQSPSKQYWHQGSLMGKLGFERVTLVPQVHYELRRVPMLSTPYPQGLQYQLDAYPILGKRCYMTLSYAYSAATVFARHRGQMEAHVSLTKGWELSGGANYLNFDHHIFTYSLSLGKYMGAFWLHLKGGVTQQLGATILQPAINLGARRFFKDATDYIHWSVFYGLSQDDITALGPHAVSDMLSGVGTYFNIRKSVSSHWVLLGTVAYRYEEYTQDRSRHVMGLEMGVAYKF